MGTGIFMMGNYPFGYKVFTAQRNIQGLDDDLIQNDSDSTVHIGI